MSKSKIAEEEQMGQELTLDDELYKWICIYPAAPSQVLKCTINQKELFNSPSRINT